jgi:hypothetical protein
MRVYSEGSVVALMLCLADRISGFAEGPPLLFAPGAGNTKSVYPSPYEARHADSYDLHTQAKLDSQSLPAGQPADGREALIVSGHTQGYLNLSFVSPAELSCIHQGSPKLASALLGASRQIVISLQDMSSLETVNTSSQPKLEPENASSLEAVNSRNLVDSKAQLLHELSHGLRRMLSSIHAVTRRCALGIELRGLMGDDTSALVSSVGGKLQIRGVVVDPHFHAAVWAWKSQDPTYFGQSIGSMWRKVLLSETLPDGSGPPSDEAVRRMSSGLVEGFFGKSFDETAREARASSDRTDNEFRECVTHNLPFFEVVWSATALVFKDMAKHKRSSVSSEKEDVDLRTSIAQALVRFPSALRRCGIQNKDEFALVDALEALIRMHFTIDRSSRHVHTVDVSIDLSEFIDDWHDRAWWDLGFRLGQLLKQMVLMIFPLKYSLDINGRLRHVEAIIQPDSIILAYMSISAFGVMLVMALMLRLYLLRCACSVKEYSVKENERQNLATESQHSDLEEAME